MAGISRSSVDLTHYNGIPLTGDLNGAIANTGDLITQVGNAAINSPSATGNSNLGFPINTSKPYWISILGSSTNQNSPSGTPRLTSFNGTTLTFTRSTTTTTDDITVQFIVTGTPA